MKKNNKIFQTFLICCILFPASISAEILSKDKENGTPVPIEITAEKMTSNQKQGRITFTGNVVAKRGKLIIFSDKMTVYNGKKSKKLEKIVANGNVKIEKEEKFATGELAVYIEKEEKIILTGNPHAWEKDNEIFAAEMIFLVEEDRFLVKGDKENKVKLTLYPEEKKE